MNPLKQKLVDEASSPLFRIMSVYDDDDPVRRTFESNINAFHVGGGYIVSVAHYLRGNFQLLRSIPEALFQSEILAKLPPNEVNRVSKHYPLDASTQKRYLSVAKDHEVKKLIHALSACRCDTTVQSLYERKICKPFLIVNLQQNQFFGDANATAELNQRHHIFHEPALNRHTFLLELEIVNVHLPEDIAVYRIVNASPAVIQLLPSVALDYHLYDDDCTDVYCLQNSPSGSNLGRLLSRAYIEGILDQHSPQSDAVTGQYIFEGLRYLIRGYFRFGSSGAPYIKVGTNSNEFAVIAVQSQACPIQLTIGNSQEGNHQWINAIATPVSTVRDDITNLRLS